MGEDVGSRPELTEPAAELARALQGGLKQQPRAHRDQLEVYGARSGQLARLVDKRPDVFTAQLLQLRRVQDLQSLGQLPGLRGRLEYVGRGGRKQQLPVVPVCREGSAKAGAGAGQRPGDDLQESRRGALEVAHLAGVGSRVGALVGILAKLPGEPLRLPDLLAPGDQRLNDQLAAFFRGDDAPGRGIFQYPAMAVESFREAGKPLAEAAPVASQPQSCVGYVGQGFLPELLEGPGRLFKQRGAASGLAGGGRKIHGLNAQQGEGSSRGLAPLRDLVDSRVEFLIIDSLRRPGGRAQPQQDGIQGLDEICLGSAREAAPNRLQLLELLQAQGNRLLAGRDPLQQLQRASQPEGGLEFSRGPGKAFNEHLSVFSLPGPAGLRLRGIRLAHRGGIVFKDSLEKLGHGAQQRDGFKVRVIEVAAAFISPGDPRKNRPGGREQLSPGGISQPGILHRLHRPGDLAFGYLPSERFAVLETGGKEELFEGVDPAREGFGGTSQGSLEFTGQRLLGGLAGQLELSRQGGGHGSYRALELGDKF